MPSHGSLTKAGKVRSQTPKIEPKGRKNRPPRLRNRLEYLVRVVAVSRRVEASRGLGASS
uniref:30S ribosomal protein S30e n=1 Tax=Fervidicoccus fontis TaxID=683846 RepID=A0A7J3ZKL9_9CREN